MVENSESKLTNSRSMRSVARPRVLVLASDALFPHFFPVDVRARLSEVADWERYAERVDSNVLRERIACADALMTTWHSPFIRAEMLGREPRVRLIAHCGGEVKARIEEVVFDLVTVTNAPEPMAAPAAEMALAMALSLVRRLPQYEREMRSDGHTDNERASEGETLFGRRVGLIGFGRIGRAFAGLIEPFGAHLYVSDPYCSIELASEHKAELLELDELLKTCSVVVLAAGLTPETRGLMDVRRLALMPDGAYLVNIARGGLIDLDALLPELRSGRISAALDVTDGRS
jgi:phosphoglycerate dehydrogenase-like enzyme